ncbi:MAG TPA: FtsX-like permease family protein [Flavitalea sp.]|nr:FtsX-like permease family protein [Flavitalea sp.]
MLKNFIKTALRVLWKRKTFSIINIFGLAVGVGATLLIALLIHNELNYDGYHKSKNRIYRVITANINRSNGEVTSKYPYSPAAMSYALRTDFPQLEKVGGIFGIGGAQIYVPVAGTSAEKRFKENDGLFWSEPSFFEIFDYTWLYGNAQRLNEPNTVVINESIARKFFDDPAKAIGKQVQLWSFRVPLNVIGVFKDLPANTDLPVRFAGSSETLKKLAPNMFTASDWTGTSGLNCFVLTAKNQNPATVENALKSFEKKYFNQEADFRRVLTLQPLTSMHLAKEIDTFTSNRMAKKELWSLGLIGIFLLLVACINFVNLSTAQSVNRSKEIGVRKVLGSSRAMLMRQFLQETGLITVIAVITGYLLAVASMPILNNLMKKGLTLDLSDNPVILLYLFFIGILVTLLAGMYPAMILSRFKPVAIFKNNKIPGTTGGITLRRGLVVFQFVIAQLLIIGTIVVIKQMQFFRNANLGFQKDGIILVNLPSDSSLKIKYPLLTNEVKQIPGVVATSLCMEAVAGTWNWTSNFTFDNREQKEAYQIDGQAADTGYYRTFGLTIVAGRIPFASDTAREFVVNEALVTKLGLSSPQEIIGKTISMEGWIQKAKIVGVVKNYNNRSLHEAIRPLALTTQSGSYEWIAVRMERKNFAQTTNRVRKVFTGIYPSYLYDQVFFNERLERYYENEAITAQLFKIFAFLAIFISCLGLYGLISFMAVQKTREVGIRKVLGASVSSIVYMFSKEFTVLIFVAFLLAAPIGYYFMNKWLEGFYFHTHIGWGVFALTILFSLVIAWFTVGFKAFRSALANPVKSLKSE